MEYTFSILWSSALKKKILKERIVEKKIFQSMKQLLV